MMKTLWRKGAVALIGLFALIGMIITGEALADIIIDNGAPGTSFTGSWPVSGGTQPYGTNSVWSRNGTTYTWTMSGQPTGTYDVHMWWSGWSSRASSVPVAINHAGGTANATINQRLERGTVEQAGDLCIQRERKRNDHCSQWRYGQHLCRRGLVPTDGWQHTPHRLPSILSLRAPLYPVRSVTFTGHGTDTDGTIAAYEWSSSINGVFANTASFSTSSSRKGPTPSPSGSRMTTVHGLRQSPKASPWEHHRHLQWNTLSTTVIPRPPGQVRGVHQALLAPMVLTPSGAVTGQPLHGSLLPRHPATSRSLCGGRSLLPGVPASPCG